MQVFHYYEPQGGVVSLLQIKEDCYKALLLDAGLLIEVSNLTSSTDLFESTLRIVDKFVVDPRNQTNL